MNSLFFQQPIQNAPGKSAVSATALKSQIDALLLVTIALRYFLIFLFTIWGGSPRIFDQRITRLYPGFYTAPKNFDIRITRFFILFRPTDGSRLLRSCTVEYDLLAFCYLRKPGFKIFERNGILEIKLQKSFHVVVSAYQKGFS
jgi:hypothetical protein